MSRATIVTFGIPLMSRSVAGDWSRTMRHFNATLGSIYNQTDPYFRVIVACTDLPDIRIPVDERLEFVHCDQLGEPRPDANNIDANRKRRAVAERLRRLGGGYLMFTDADDLVSSRLVAYARMADDPNGYLVRAGYLFSAGDGRLAPLPSPGMNLTFDRFCGTSNLIRFAADDLPRGPDDETCRYHRIMHGHQRAREDLAADGRPLAPIPFPAVAYVRNTGENISHRFREQASDAWREWQGRLQQSLDDHPLARTARLDGEFNLPAADWSPGGLPPEFAAPPEIRLSVVVTTYRRPAGLRRLLAALRPQVERHPDREIVVVNDGSHDEAYARVVGDFADVVRYDPLEKNLGTAGARNWSTLAARGEYLVFTDDDCEPPPSWLDWLSARLALNPEVDVVAGTTLPLWTEKRSFVEKVQAHYQFIPHPWPAGGHQIFVTANTAIRRSLFRKAGGFPLPGRLLTAGEDTELCLRLIDGGARYVVDRDWFVRHEVGGTLRQQVRRYWHYGYANTWATRRGASSRVHAEFASATRRSHPRYALAVLRSFLSQSATFPGNRAARAASAFAASLFMIAHHDGCAVAALEQETAARARRPALQAR